MNLMKRKANIATSITKKEKHYFVLDSVIMGDVWKGKFDYLKKAGIDVVYLPRTPKVSTTKIKRDLKLHSN